MNHEEEVISQARRAAFALVLLALAIVGGVALLLRDARQQNENLANVLLAVSDDHIVDSWLLTAEFDEATAGEGLMEFTGTFDCTDDVVGDNPLIRFASVLRATQPGEAALLRPGQPPIDASRVCDQTITFEVPWSGLTGLESITEPTEYQLIVTASSPGYIEDRSASGVFTILPPEAE